jgi:hypothetical protein
MMPNFVDVGFHLGNYPVKESNVSGRVSRAKSTIASDNW